MRGPKTCRAKSPKRAGIGMCSGRAGKAGPLAPKAKQGYRAALAALRRAPQNGGWLQRRAIWIQLIPVRNCNALNGPR